MRISDWSSDVCSSDLLWSLNRLFPTRPRRLMGVCGVHGRGATAPPYGAGGFPLLDPCADARSRAPPRQTVQEDRQQCWTRPIGPRRSRRSEEHTSELQSLMRISYAVFCLKKINKTTNNM